MMSNAYTNRRREAVREAAIRAAIKRERIAAIIRRDTACERIIRKDERGGLHR